MLYRQWSYARYRYIKRWTLSSATDINEIGQVTGWSNAIPHVGSNYNAFLFDNGVMQDIGSLNGNGGHTSAESINDSGQIVGASLGLHGNHAFLYEQGVRNRSGNMVEQVAPIQ
ncbi:MAG: hypothetical protein IPN95_28360 [Bacteroidetes bacterium]|nr:hypothetical protein [Bacteroidota bacterium]